MSTKNRRFLMLAVAVMGSALLQACAVTTGGFVPTREPLRSQYELLRPRGFSNVPHSLMTTTHEPSLLGYKYY
ncbi:MAG: hypothetical protein ABJE47_05135 [bacterium]